jgi:hypothetical protein
VTVEQTYPFAVEVVWPGERPLIERWCGGACQGSSRGHARTAYFWHRERGMKVAHARVRQESNDRLVYRFGSEE